MRYPQFLEKGQTIGYVAPSFGCATEPYKSAFEHALEVLEKKGYHANLGPNCFAEKGIGISNDPALCGAELNESYLGNCCDAIISCGGGELMCEVVPYMEFERIKKARPKWYMGFSDNTNFTFLSATIADTAAIYGPCASSFGMEPWHESIEDAFDLLCGKKNRFHGYDRWEKESNKCEETPLATYNVTEPTRYHSFIPDLAASGKLLVEEEHAQIVLEGRLIGGCMDCLVNLLGTSFDQVKAFNEKYKEEKKIWFLESCDLNVMAIRRAIWQMKHAGWFDNVAGFLIGRPVCMGQEMFGIDQYRAVTDLLAGYNVPVLMDLDIGHMSPMMPIVCGGTAKVTMEEQNFEIEYTWK